MKLVICENRVLQKPSRRPWCHIQGRWCFEGNGLIVLVAGHLVSPMDAAGTTLCIRNGSMMTFPSAGALPLVLARARRTPSRT